MKTPPNINHAWASLLVEELVRNGVTSFFLAPGSRSSPLACSAAHHPRVRLTVHFDERGLGFAAVGHARAAGRPAAVITTSGTAAANLLPAVCEADLDRLPMIILTADRPPELRDAGANQAMDQVRLFGSRARWFFDLPCPTADADPRFALTTVDQAVHRALSAPAGPVHLNVMFREPLAPVKDEFRFAAWRRALEPWMSSSSPFTRYDRPKRQPSPDALDDFTRAVRGVDDGVIVAGELRNDVDRRAVLALAGDWNWPVLADVRSGLRGSGAIRYADLILSSARLARALKPSAVLRVGGRLVSKRVASFVDSCGAAVHAVAADHPKRMDASHRVTHRFDAGIGEVCRALRRHRVASSTNLRRWQEADRRVDRFLGTAWEDGNLSEPAVAALLSAHLPPGEFLFAGNSMPVRDLEFFAGAPRFVFANRGASGIDGNIATACGLVSGSGKPVTALLGDLTALHDLNSLALAAAASPPVRVVVLNNDGGGIFHFLPVADSEPAFEKIFAAPHGMSFRSAANLFGLAYHRPANTADLLERIRRPATGAEIIEIATRRRDNRRAHADLFDLAVQALKGA